MKNSEQLATEHWSWLARWTEMVFKDAFIHGYKHGVQDTEDKANNNKEKEEVSK